MWYLSYAQHRLHLVLHKVGGDATVDGGIALVQPFEDGLQVGLHNAQVYRRKFNVQASTCACAPLLRAEQVR